MVFGGGSIGGNVIGAGIAFTIKDFFSQAADNLIRKIGSIDSVTERMVTRVERNMKRLRIGLAGMALGGAMLLPVGMAVKTSMEFNQVMSEVIAKTADGAENFDRLKGKAIELGKETKFSAMEAGQGMTFLAMAGFDAEQQLQAMPGLLSLAAAGNTDLALTADIVSDTLTAMNMSAADTARMADIMALGANRANTSISMMGETFKYSTATANQLGVSMEVLTAMTGMLGDIGLKGSVAGTAINQMLLGFTKIRTSDKALAALEKLDLSLSDLTNKNGDLKDMTDLIPLIANRVKGIHGNIAQTNILQDIFGLRGAKGFAAFLKEGGKDLRSFVTELENSAGAANRISKDMMDNLAGDITIFKSTLESTLIGIGDSIEPYIRPIVRFFTGLINLIGQFTSTRLGGFVMFVVTALGALILVGGAVLSVVSLLGMLSAKAALGFAAMGMAQVGATFATQGLTAGMVALGAAIWTALAPILPIILAIGAALAVVASGYFAVKKANSEFNEVLEDTNKKASGFKGLMQRIGGVFQGAMEIWRSATEEGFTLSDKMYQALSAMGILEFVVNLGTWIVRIKNFFRGIAEVFSYLYVTVKDFVKTVYDYIKPVIDGIFDKLGFSIGKATSKMETWKKVGKVVGIFILSVLAPALIMMATAALTVVAAFATAVAVMYVLYRAIMITYAVLRAFVEFFAAGFMLIYDVVESFVMFFVDLFNGATFRKAGRNLVNGLKNGILEAWDSLKALIIKLISSLPFGEKVLGYLGIETTEDTSNSPSLTRDTPQSASVQRLQEQNAENARLKAEASQPVVLDQSSITEKLISQTFILDGEEITGSVLRRMDTEASR